MYARRLKMRQVLIGMVLLSVASNGSYGQQVFGIQPAVLWDYLARAHVEFEYALFSEDFGCQRPSVDGAVGRTNCQFEAQVGSTHRLDLGCPSSTEAVAVAGFRTTLGIWLALP